jgi:hypothetical protein
VATSLAFIFARKTPYKNKYPGFQITVTWLTALLIYSLMSQSQLTAASSSNFQLIFNNALKAYEKRTKKGFTRPSTRRRAPYLQLT